jgi:MFS family permease
VAVGWLLAVNSVGSVIGSLAVASRRAVGPRTLALALVVLGVSTTIMGASPTLLVALLLAVPVGAGGAGFIAGTSGLTQPRTPPEMRGRVLALQSTAFLGSLFLGGPITGWVADRIGAGWALSYGGLVAIAVLAWYLWVGHRRPAESPSVITVTA